MTRTVCIAIALAVASAYLAADDSPTITVTGCIQNFSAKGTVGTTERGYLLTNATTGKAGEPSVPATRSATPTGTGGTVGADQASNRAARSYLLDGRDGELKDQVGHQVEVTGTVTSPDGDPPRTDEQRLQVSAIRRVASKCSSKVR